jgi:tetratricopeptide (TPR) repeat protein
MLEQHREGPPALPGRRYLDSWLEALIRRCLAFDPKARLNSAAELAIAFRAGLARISRRRRWFVQRPVEIVVASAFLGLAGLAGGRFLSDPQGLPVMEQAISAYERGQKAYREGNFKEAINCYNLALNIEPGSAECVFARGRAYQQMGDWGRAVQNYDDAYGKKSDGRYKACSGYCLSQWGRHGAAHTDYKLAIEHGFVTAEVNNDWGWSLLREKNFKGAKEKLDLAIQLEPRLQAAYHNRGLIALIKHDRNNPAEIEAGIQDLETAMHLGLPTADLYFDAALLATYSPPKPDQAAWAKRVLDFLALAIEFGYDPTKAGKDPTFAALQNNPRFQALVNKSRPDQKPQPAVRLVDPVQDNGG